MSDETAVTVSAQSLEALTSLIQRSVVIGQFEKEDFIELLPSLNEAQLSEVMAFFSEAEKEIDAVKDEFKEKENQLYSEFMPAQKEFFEKAHKMINVARESKNAKNEATHSEELLQELNNL